MEGIVVFDKLRNILLRMEGFAGWIHFCGENKVKDHACQ